MHVVKSIFITFIIFDDFDLILLNAVRMIHSHALRFYFGFFIIGTAVCLERARGIFCFVYLSFAQSLSIGIISS